MKEIIKSKKERVEVIFDTNSIYYLSTQLSDTQFGRLVEKVTKNELKIFISPISVIEMTSRLGVNPTDFEIVKKSVSKLFELNPVFLRQPETELESYLYVPFVDEKHWKECFRIIASAKNITELEKGVARNHLLYFVHYTKIQKFRDSYESQYVSDMHEILKSIIPNFEKKVKKNKNTRIPKEDLSNFNAFLSSNKWEDLCIRVFEGRTEMKVEHSYQKAIVLRKGYFFFKSYENLMLRILRDGYVPNLKKKNDYNDLHFNVYFNNQNNYIFVTSENNTVFKELLDCNRCLKIDDLIN